MVARFLWLPERERRPIVIAVDLDHAIISTGGGNTTLEARSRLYRAITRAQLMAAVVNEIVVGGWLV